MKMEALKMKHLNLRNLLLALIIVFFIEHMAFDLDAILNQYIKTGDAEMVMEEIAVLECVDLRFEWMKE